MRLRFPIAMVLAFTAFVTAISHVYALGIDQRYDSPKKGPDWVRRFGGVFGRGRSIALLVGISDYIGTEKGGFNSLDATKNDVERMRKFLLDEAGFDSVYVLTEERAIKSRIESLMVDVLPAQAGINDRFLFYWSGHGIARSIGNNRTLGYLPLSDSLRTSYSTMVSMDDISRWDGLFLAKQTLFILDACLSGLAGGQSKSDVVSLELAQLSQPSHHLFAAGTSKEQTIAGDRWNGSLFTDAFIRGASGAAVQPGTAVVSLSDIRTYVRRQVAFEKDRANWTKTITPQLRELQVSNGEFYFLRTKDRVAVRDPQGDTTRTVMSSPAGTERVVSMGTELPRVGGMHSDLDDKKPTHTENKEGEEPKPSNEGTPKGLLPESTLQIVVAPDPKLMSTPIMVPTAASASNGTQEQASMGSLAAITTSNRSGTVLTKERWIVKEDTVLDTKTKLIWQRCTVGQLWSNGRGCTGTAKPLWSGEAENGQGDGWRLPTIDELQSIVDSTREKPAIDIDIFPGTQLSSYWSISDGGGWGVPTIDFEVGTRKLYKGFRAMVRYVRNSE